ncbi:hypothetical protein [Cohaesibacter celericrescens]|uniref:hypothetical protein n=1 Tax=Cohaesibacter celericrescens TaxID=2067669 RepID=UPI003566A53D
MHPTDKIPWPFQTVIVGVVWKRMAGSAADHFEEATLAASEPTKPYGLRRCGGPEFSAGEKLIKTGGTKNAQQKNTQHNCSSPFHNAQDKPNKSGDNFNELFNQTLGNTKNDEELR